MKAKTDIKSLLKILQTKEGILPGSLSKVTPKTAQKNSSKGAMRFYWYLTWKENGKSRATYIPSKDIPRVSRAIENMRKVKDYLSSLAMENLKLLKEERDVRKNQ
jgi:hypothetical protein